jgi:ferritin-like protein
MAGVHTGTASTAVLSGDLALLDYLVGLELAVATVYGEGARLLTSPAAVSAAAAFHAHHAAHAAALVALLAGSGASPGPNRDLLTNLAASLQVLTDENAELSLLYSLEEELAATYEWALGRLTGTPAQQEAAAILTVEGQHAVALGTFLDKPLSELIVSFQGVTGYLVPADFGITTLG